MGISSRAPEVKWLPLKRCLAIVRRLQAGPASKEELMRAARELVPDAYEAGNDRARRKRFERDMENVRYELGVVVDYDRREGHYRLLDPGDLLGVALSPEAMHGLAFLLSTFAPQSAASDQARPLLEAIQSLLPAGRLRRLEGHASELEIDLRHLDEGDISAQVWSAVQRAAAERHVLQFDYLSPYHDPPACRTHLVEPYRLKFQEGHWFLQAYCLRWIRREPLSPAEREHAGWLAYRLSRIQTDGLEVWPDKFPTDQRRRRLVPLEYRLGPVLHRGGVSSRFEDMQVSAVEADGWVTVSARTDDLFTARRILLAYGENCQVLAPPQLLREIGAAARKMAGFYPE
jgi:predicted DNA-binding transcriptional regulator YafY